VDKLDIPQGTLDLMTSTKRSQDRIELLQGTLDVLILRSAHAAMETPF
jgi:hypothetical protein